MVPHITEAIKNWIESVSHIPVDGKEGPADVCVIELGGTVGTYFSGQDPNSLFYFKLIFIFVFSQ